MFIKRKTVLIVLLLVLISSTVVAFIHLRSRQKNFLVSAIKKGTIQSYLSHIPVLVPQNIFSANSFFLAGNRIVMNLREKDGIFHWRIGRDFQGELIFRMYIYPPNLNKNERESKDRIISNAHLQVKRKRGPHLDTLIEREISEINFRARRFLGKRLRKNITLNQGDELEFFMRISPPKIEGKNVEYGITVPKLIDNHCLKKKKFKNLIIISIDTLRADYLGVYRKLYGEQFQFSYSPNLDEFAEKSVIFKHAYTPETATWPALASLMVSREPVEHGVLYNGEFLESNYESIATHMLNLGYRTLSLHGNAYYLNIPGFEEKFNFFNRDFDLIDFSLKKLRKHMNYPFFHWYHFMGVHNDYTPPQWVLQLLSNQENIGNENLVQNYNLYKIMRGEEEINDRKLKHIRTSYAGELYHLDFKLKKIFDFLKSHGLWEDALIVVTSDHGEDLYEHNSYFFHYPSIYETSLRVPLMIKFPGQKKQLVIEQPVSLMDVFPTIFEYFSLEDSPTKSPEFSGISLLPLIRGDRSLFENRVLYAGTEEFKIISAVKNNWKVIYNPNRITPVTNARTPYPIQEIEFYNVASDFQEINEIQDQHYKIAKELIENIIRFKEKKVLDKKTGTKKGEFSLDEKQKEEVAEALKTLGYIK